MPSVEHTCLLVTTGIFLHLRIRRFRLNPMPLIQHARLRAASLRIIWLELSLALQGEVPGWGAAGGILLLPEGRLAMLRVSYV